jgi:hypothetical protein
MACEEVVDRGIVEIVDLVVKHEGKLRKLVKALKNACCKAVSSDSEDTLMEQMNELVDRTLVWGKKQKRQWKKLAKGLVRSGSWIPETAEDTPW